ncbi:hypothetical protein PLICRDRAFT_170624 [Plicaturopsis crispa FD-325 SS-3]|nr:hypothetical protein PLICRDRAFT_170624 [Plicaturopsis crispa FD-325 SS-3]
MTPSHSKPHHAQLGKEYNDIIPDSEDDLEEHHSQTYPNVERNTEATSMNTRAQCTPPPGAQDLPSWKALSEVAESDPEESYQGEDEVDELTSTAPSSPHIKGLTEIPHSPIPGHSPEPTPSKQQSNAPHPHGPTGPNAHNSDPKTDLERWRISSSALQSTPAPSITIPIPRLKKRKYLFDGVLIPARKPRGGSRPLNAVDSPSREVARLGQDAENPRVTPTAIDLAKFTHRDTTRIHPSRIHPSRIHPSRHLRHYLSIPAPPSTRSGSATDSVPASEPAVAPPSSVTSFSVAASDESVFGRRTVFDGVIVPPPPRARIAVPGGDAHPQASGSAQPKAGGDAQPKASSNAQPKAGSNAQPKAGASLASVLAATFVHNGAVAPAARVPRYAVSIHEKRRRSASSDDEDGAGEGSATPEKRSERELRLRQHDVGETRTGSDAVGAYAHDDIVARAARVPRYAVSTNSKRRRVASSDGDEDKGSTTPDGPDGRELRLRQHDAGETRTGLDARTTVAHDDTAAPATRVIRYAVSTNSKRRRVASSDDEDEASEGSTTPEGPSARMRPRAADRAKSWTTAQEEIDAELEARPITGGEAPMPLESRRRPWNVRFLLEGRVCEFEDERVETAAVRSGEELRENGARGRVHVARPDQGRAAMFAERLEEMFGPGDLARGAGGRPNAVRARGSGDATRVTHHGRDSSESGASQTPSHEDSSERDEDIPLRNEDTNWVDKVERWDATLRTLVKGKVKVTSEGLQNISETLAEIDNALEDLTEETIRDARLPDTLKQLSKLDNIPQHDAHRLRRRAGRIAKTLAQTLQLRE